MKDLPKNDLGVDVDKDFEPRYVSIRGKADVLKNIKTAASKAKAVFLAPDPDREGEAIAWHLAESIRENKGKRKDGEVAPIHRLTFNEITQRAVGTLETRVGSTRTSSARGRARVLDRLVGWVSPFLWRTVRYGLSAGARRWRSVICDAKKSRLQPEGTGRSGRAGDRQGRALQGHALQGRRPPCRNSEGRRRILGPGREGGRGLRRESPA